TRRIAGCRLAYRRRRQVVLREQEPDARGRDLEDRHSARALPARAFQIQGEGQASLASTGSGEPVSRRRASARTARRHLGTVRRGRADVYIQRLGIEPTLPVDGSSARAYLVCRAGFAGRDKPFARATERPILAPGPDPRCISGRPYPAAARAASVLPCSTRYAL